MCNSMCRVPHTCGRVCYGKRYDSITQLGLPRPPHRRCLSLRTSKYGSPASSVAIVGNVRVANTRCSESHGSTGGCTFGQAVSAGMTDLSPTCHRISPVAVS